METSEPSAGESESLVAMATGKAEEKYRPSGQWLQTDDPTLEQIIATALESDDERFNELWNGKTAGYPTRSEADCALVSKLWYYADDQRLVDEAFRRSDLMREKWNRRSYREATLRHTRDNDRHDGKYYKPADDSTFSL